MNKKRSDDTNVQKQSRAGKAFAALLIGLCFLILAGWLILLGRGILAFID